MSLIQGALSRTATTAADMDAARAEHQPAEELDVTTTEDRLLDKITSLSLAARDVLSAWGSFQAHNGDDIAYGLLSNRLAELAATLEEIGG